MTTNVQRSQYTSTRYGSPRRNVEWRRRRFGLFTGPSNLEKVSELVWLAFGVVEGLFAVRFALKLMGANPENPFARLVYGFTDLFLRPFDGLVAAPTAGAMILEISTIVAMAVYALAFWVVLRALWVVFYRSEVESADVQMAVTQPAQMESSAHDEGTIAASTWRRDF